MQIVLLISLFLYQSPWITYTDEYNTFQIDVPCQMEVTEDKFILDIGEIEVVTHKCQGSKEDPNFLYVVQEYDYPDGFLSMDSLTLIKDLIQASLEESEEKLGGTVDYQRALTDYSYPGVLYRISFDNRKKVMKGHIYIIEGTYYSIQVYTNIDHSINDGMDKFLESFRIL